MGGTIRAVSSSLGAALKPVEHLLVIRFIHNAWDSDTNTHPFDAERFKGNCNQMLTSELLRGIKAELEVCLRRTEALQPGYWARVMSDWRNFRGAPEE